MKSFDARKEKLQNLKNMMKKINLKQNELKQEE